MTTNLSLLSRAAVIAGILAVSGLPALAQTSQPAVAPSAPTIQTTAPVAKTTAPVAKSTGAVEHKATKDKSHVVKKHNDMVKTAKSDTGHKPAPVKPEAAPASGNAVK
jgi:hypothetical protein